MRRHGRGYAGVMLLPRTLLACLLLALGPVTAGCGGSQLSPEYVAAANRAASGAGTAPAGSSVAPDPTGTSSPSGLSGTSGTPIGTADGADPSSPPVSGAVGPPGASSGGHANADGGGTGGRAGKASNAAPVAAPGGRPSCKGFRNQTGVTDDTVTIANIADISGPVPGIFTPAQQAVKAYVAFFNATADLCGRRLELLPLDSRTDAGADQTAYTKACAEAFAAVGSMSAFDSGGAATAQGCGLPDLRAASTSDARNACTTCFGAQATDLNAFQNAVPDFFLAHHRAATQKAAMVYVNAAAAVHNAQTQQAVEERRGMRFVYSASFDVAEFNYTPYVQRMKQKDVRWVQFVGSQDQAVRLAQAMQSAEFHPEVFLLDPTGYDPRFVSNGGSAVDGAYVFIDFVPFEEAAGSPELQLYERWLQQVAPGAQPSYFGLFAWSAARLFGAQAAALGGNLDRAALVDRISRVDGWTDHGLHAPQAVGPKQNSSCWRFLQLRDGAWTPAGGRQYLCRGSTKLR